MQLYVSMLFLNSYWKECDDLLPSLLTPFRKEGEKTSVNQERILGLQNTTIPPPPRNLLVRDTLLIGLLKVYYNTVHTAACPAIWYALPVLYNEECHMRKTEMNQR